jgi:hypothetical protein
VSKRLLLVESGDVVDELVVLVGDVDPSRCTSTTSSS